MSDTSINLYDNVYGDFASSAEAAVRRETYGEDLGQSSWLTASEWLEFADHLAIGGFDLRAVEDMTTNAAEVALRWRFAYLAEKPA